MIRFVAIPQERLKILLSEKDSLENLEQLSNSKIICDEEVSIECEDPLMTIRVEEVIKAFGRGFDLEDALDLLDESFILETIGVNEFAGKSKNRQRVLKGRVIGRKGSIHKWIEENAEVKISIYGKTISIIGQWESVQKAKQIVEKLLSGAKHSSVYHFFEGRLVK